MESVRHAGTGPELAIRRELEQLGLDLSTEAPPAAGRSRPDFVVESRGVVIYSDGCFWHGCPIHGTLPKNNAVWWRRKLAANQDRDERVRKQLEAAGWTVVRIWEHEDPRAAAERIRSMPARGRVAG